MMIKRIIGYILMTIPVLIMLGVLFYSVYQAHNLLTAITVLGLVFGFAAMIILGTKLILEDNDYDE